MQINSPDRNTNGTNAIYMSLREMLAREVSGSAVLADLLEKLNAMQEAHARPADFKRRFDEFVARAAEHLALVRPFLPVLEQFLPSHKEFHASREPRRIEATLEPDLISELT